MMKTVTVRVRFGGSEIAVQEVIHSEFAEDPEQLARLEDHLRYKAGREIVRRLEADGKVTTSIENAWWEL